MYIAIDSAENMAYTGVISGGYPDISSVYDKFIVIFKKRRVNPPFHWRKISRRVKYSCMNEVVQTINDSKLLINIFEHKRAPKMERKIVFYGLLPQHISLRISPWIRELAENMKIEVDDDYRLGEDNTTAKFLKSLIEELCFVSKGIRVSSRKEHDTIKATIKQKSGILNFYGNVVRSDDSRGVQIMDLILGYDLQFKCRTFNRNKLHYWSVFKK